MEQILFESYKTIVNSKYYLTMINLRIVAFFQNVKTNIESSDCVCMLVFLTPYTCLLTLAKLGKRYSLMLLLLFYLSGKE